MPGGAHRLVQVCVEMMDDPGNASLLLCAVKLFPEGFVAKAQVYYSGKVLPAESRK